MSAFVPLTSDADVDRLLAASHDAPVIVFKHSESCGASWMAEASLAGQRLPVPVHQVVVQRHRQTSALIAERLGIRHESPQVIILAGGRAAWHTSHAGVTRERVLDAWQRLALPPATVSA
ncbi:MAG: bacillithiol system redox-active protein YtxJ [Vicinamibacterales bacterium]